MLEILAIFMICVCCALMGLGTAIVWLAKLDKRERLQTMHEVAKVKQEFTEAAKAVADVHNETARQVMQLQDRVQALSIATAQGAQPQMQGHRR